MGLYKVMEPACNVFHPIISERCKDSVSLLALVMSEYEERENLDICTLTENVERIEAIEHMLERIEATLASKTSALLVYIAIMSNLRIHDKVTQMRGGRY